MRDGKVELSCGYTCEVIPEEGEFEGERFDHRQKKIVYDHVAVVEQGRAGRECRLRLDGAHQLSDNGGEDEPVDQPKDKKMKIKIAGKEVEVSDDVAKAYEQEQAAAKADADTAASKLKDAQAKCDELQGKLDVALKSRSDEDDKKKIQEAVKARVALVRDAARFLGDTKIDEMSDLDVKRAVIAKVQPELKLDGKGPEYIGGAFEFVVSAASATNGENALDRLGNVLRGDAAGGNQDDLPDPDKAHAEMVKRNADAVSEYRKRLLG